jgi:hypothetical protein
LQGAYVTIHITPETEFSYVSFESNIPMASYKPVLVDILAIFKPGKFIMTVFANQASKTHETSSYSSSMKAQLSQTQIIIFPSKGKTYTLIDRKSPSNPCGHSTPWTIDVTTRKSLELGRHLGIIA